MSLNPHGPHLERAELDMVLDVPLQDGVTYARGIVIEAEASFFVVELTDKWPGERMRFDQGALGVLLVADG